MLKTKMATKIPIAIQKPKPAVTGAVPLQTTLSKGLPQGKPEAKIEQKLAPALAADEAKTEAPVRAKIVKETLAVVLDIGTGYCKGGFAGQPRPSCVISSTVGKPLQETAKTGDNRKENYIGADLLSKKDLKYINPLSHGIVVDWDSVEALWRYIFHREMKILPEEHAVLVSDPPLSPTTNREKYAEMMFETFSIPAIHIAYQSVSSMYSYGRTTGLVVECGHGVSYVVPVHEGYNMPSITGRADYAGSNLSDHLLKQLNEAGNMFTEKDLHIIEDIKKTCCYVSKEALNEIRVGSHPTPVQVVDYELPDGHLITVGKERVQCPEIIFNPSLIKSNEPALHNLTVNSINKCDANLRKSMLSNVLLCGGSTMFAGFADRFRTELERLGLNNDLVIASSNDRKYSVWIGGSIMASLKSFQQLWVHKSEYDERGPFVIYRKCY